MTVKNGFKYKKQSYLCKGCNCQFYDRQILDTKSLIEDYVFGKQTQLALSKRYSVSVSTIARRLNEIRTTRIISSHKSVVVLMDTTYWGRKFGVVTFKDNKAKVVLWRKFVKYETLADYKEGIDWLLSTGFTVQGIVCDGLRGMFQLFGNHRVQMCQYHQVSIVRRYLTQNPELDASVELWKITKHLTKSNKEDFIDKFQQWEQKWADFLKERNTDKRTGKTYYIHKKLRSAYLSLKRNMPYLWTFYDYPQAELPNTNNSLEATFADLKTKLRNHNGLSIKNRKMFIDEYFRLKFIHKYPQK